MAYTRGRVATKGFRHFPDLRRHYLRHRAEFPPGLGIPEYAQRAEAFLGGPIGQHAAECTRRDGSRVRYNEPTRELGILYTDGHIATYFILGGTIVHGRHYFCENCKK